MISQYIREIQLMMSQEIDQLIRRRRRAVP